MAAHQHGVALLFARTETDTFHRLVWPYVDSVLFLKGRPHFHYPDGSRARGNSGAPVLLAAYSSADTWRISTSGIPGIVVKP